MFLREYSFAFCLSLSISSLLIPVSLLSSQTNLTMSVGLNFFRLFTYAMI
nr:MAG TPA: hypothetical protein [Caudoviricetes sp.]